MIKRITDQKLTWLDLEERIWEEVTTVEWYFLGLLIKTRRLVVSHTLPESSDSKIGFGK